MEISAFLQLVLSICRRPGETCDIFCQDSYVGTAPNAIWVHWNGPRSKNCHPTSTILMVYICSECVYIPLFWLILWSISWFLGVKHWCPARTPTVGRCPEGNTVWQPSCHFDIETSNFVEISLDMIVYPHIYDSMIHIDIHICKSSIPMWFCILTIVKEHVHLGCGKAPAAPAWHFPAARPDAQYLSELEDPNVLSWDFLLTVSVSPSHTSRSGLPSGELT